MKTRRPDPKKSDPISRWLARHGLANRKLVVGAPGGHYRLRITHRAAFGKKSPHSTIRCGDCDNKLEIWYGGETLEIGGVHASVLEWRKILLPLLDLALPEQGLETPAVAAALRREKPGKRWRVARDPWPRKPANRRASRRSTKGAK